MRQREGVPYDPPIGATPGLGTGADDAFETLDSLILRYVDHVLAQHYGQTTDDDFAVSVTGSDALGTYDFSATVAYDYTEALTGGSLAIDRSESFSYTFSEAGQYSDGTGFTFFDNGWVTTTLTGGGNVSSRNVTGTLGGNDTYTLGETKTATLTLGSGSSTSTLSLQHVGSDTFGLTENRSESYLSGTIHHGDQVYTWTEDNDDDHTFQLTGSALVSTLTGSTPSSRSQTFSQRETGSDDHALIALAWEFLGEEGRLDSGLSTFSWSETGQDSLTQVADGTWAVSNTAGGGSQTGTFTSSLYHFDDATQTQFGTYGLLADGGDGDFTWETSGTFTHSATETATETLTSSYSASATESPGSVVDRGDALVTLSYTATSSATDTFHGYHTGSQSLVDGAIQAESGTFTWEADGQGGDTLAQTARQTASHSVTTSWSFAHGSGRQVAEDRATTTTTYRSSGTDTNHGLDVTATLDQGENGVLTGGTFSRSRHEEGPASRTWDSSGQLSSSGSSTATLAAGGAVTSGTATLSRPATFTSLDRRTETLTLDATDDGTLGVGGVLTDGSSALNLTGPGTSTSTYGETATETLGSNSTLELTLGGFYASETLTLGSTTTATVTASHSSPANSLSQTASFGLGAGGTVTAGNASSSFTEDVTLAEAHRTETGTETSSGGSTMTYREGLLFLRSSASHTGSGGHTATLDSTVSSTLGETGTAAYGLAGVYTSGSGTATYRETGSNDRLVLRQLHTLTDTELATTTYVEGGYFSSLTHSAGHTQTYSNTATAAGDHTLSRTSSLTLGFDGLAVGGGGTASYHEEHGSDTFSTSVRDVATGSDSVTWTLAEGQLTANGSRTDVATTTQTLIDSALSSSTLDSTSTEAIGPGGALLAGTDSFTYHEAGAADTLSLAATSTLTGTLQFTGLEQVGDSLATGSLRSTSSSTFSSGDSSTFTGLGSHSSDGTGVRSLTLGGVIAGGSAHTTLGAAGTTTFTEDETGSETGFTSSTLSLHAGGYTSDVRSSATIRHALTADTYSRTPYSEQATLHETIGLSGTIVGGNNDSSYHEGGGTETYSLTDDTTLTATDTATQTASFHEAFARSSATVTTTLTTGLASFYGGDHTLDRTATTSLGAGGTITSGLQDATWSRDYGGNWMRTEAGGTASSSEEGEATSSMSFNEGPDTFEGEGSLDWGESFSWSESLGYSGDADGRDSVTLGLNGLITGGGRSATLHEQSTFHTYTGTEEGVLAGDYSRTGGLVLPPDEFRRDFVQLDRAELYDVTSSGSASYTLSQTISHALGVSGSITGGHADSSLHTSSSDTWTHHEFGDEDSTHYPNSNDFGLQTDAEISSVDDESTITHTETTTLDLRGTVTLGSNGTITSGGSWFTRNAIVRERDRGDSSGTRTVTGSDLTKHGDLDTTHDTTVSSTLSAAGTLTLGLNGTITAGSQSYTTTASFSHTYSEALTNGTATLADLIGGTSSTVSATDYETLSGYTSTRETGSLTFGPAAAILSGHDSYTWEEDSDRSRSLAMEDGTTFDVDQSATESYSLYETGTETLGAGGTVTAGSDGFTWSQSGETTYGLHDVGGVTTETYTLDLTDSLSSSWLDIGNDTLGLADRILAGDDDYTWDHARSVTQAATVLISLSAGSTTSVHGQGSDSHSLHDVGQGYLQEDGEYGGDDAYTWTESSSNTGTLAATTDNYLARTGHTVSVAATGEDSYDQTLTGTLSDVSSAATSTLSYSETFVLAQGHSASTNTRGGGSSVSGTYTNSYSFDVTSELDSDLDASGSRVHDAAGHDCQSLAYTYDLSTPGTVAFAQTYRSGTIEWTVAVDSTIGTDSRETGSSTLHPGTAGPTSSFDYSYTYTETADSHTGGREKDPPHFPPPTYATFNYDNTGAVSSTLHGWGGGATYSSTWSGSTGSFTVTGSVPTDVGNFLETELNTHITYDKSVARGGVNAAFGGVQGNRGAVHLGTGLLGEALTTSGTYVAADLLEFVGGLVARNLVLDGPGRGVDEIYPALQAPGAAYHLALEEGTVGDPTWKPRPDLARYRRAWDAADAGSLAGPGDGGDDLKPRDPPEIVEDLQPHPEVKNWPAGVPLPDRERAIVDREPSEWDSGGDALLDGSSAGTTIPFLPRDMAWLFGGTEANVLMRLADPEGLDGAQIDGAAAADPTRAAQNEVKGPPWATRWQLWERGLTGQEWVSTTPPLHVVEDEDGVKASLGFSTEIIARHQPIASPGSYFGPHIIASPPPGIEASNTDLAAILPSDVYAKMLADDAVHRAYWDTFTGKYLGLAGATTQVASGLAFAFLTAQSWVGFWGGLAYAAKGADNFWAILNDDETGFNKAVQWGTGSRPVADTLDTAVNFADPYLVKSVVGGVGYLARRLSGSAAGAGARGAGAAVEAGSVALNANSGLRTAEEAGISAAQARRIQNAADRTGQQITVVGSRAKGTAGPNSDWDYILPGKSSQRHSARSSLPRGSAGGELNFRGMETGIDIWQDYNPNAINYGPLRPSQPHVIFTPKIQ